MPPSPAAPSPAVARRQAWLESLLAEAGHRGPLDELAAHDLLASFAAGRLGARRAGRPPTPASTRALRAAIRYREAARGAAVLTDPAPRADTAPADLARSLRIWLDSFPPPERLAPRDLRARAVLAVLLELPWRTGRIAALRTGDPLPLTAPARRAVADWEAAREHVMSRLDPWWAPPAALWTTIRPSQHHGTWRPAGMPLQPVGLRRAWAAATARANTELYAAPGYTLLPARMEAARRAVHTPATTRTRP